MRSLSASDGTLVIQSPIWLGILLIVLGIAVTLAVFVVKMPRPWRLGGLLLTIVLLWGGWYMLGKTTTFESRGFIVDGMWGEEERVGWLQVRGIETPRNYDTEFLIIQLRNTNEVVIDVSGLNADEKARIVLFVKSKLHK